MSKRSNEHLTQKQKLPGLTQFAHLGQRHGTDSIWREQKVREWKALIESHLVKNRYEIMRPGAVRGDFGQLELPVTDFESYPVDLNDYDGDFVRDDYVMRFFGGVHRFADEYQPMDDTMNNWLKTRFLAAFIVPAGAVSLVVGGSAAWSAGIRTIAESTAAMAKSTVAIAKAKIELAKQQAKHAALEIKTQLSAEDTSNLQLVARNIVTCTANINILMGNRDLAQATISSIQSGFTYAERMASAFPQSFNTAVEVTGNSISATVNPILSPISKSLMIEPSTALIVTSTLVLGYGAFKLYQWYARRKFTAVNLDRARDSIRGIAQRIAKQVMANVMQNNQDWAREDIDEYTRQERARKFDQDAEMMKLYRESLQMQRSAETGRQAERKISDETLLNTLISQYERYSVNYFQLLVYVAIKIKSGNIDAEAGRNVLSMFGQEQGPLMTYLQSNYDQLQQQIQGSQNAIGQANEQRLATVRENLGTVETMIRIVNGLRAAHWSMEAITAVDWEVWVRDLDMKGKITLLEIASQDFMKTQGHSLQTTDVSVSMTREQEQNILDQKLQDTVFTGSDLENHEKMPCIIISYKRNSYDKGKDMWYEKDIPEVSRPAFQINLNTRNFERGSKIFQDLLHKTGWINQDNAERFIFNSFQSLWLYRWMGPSCTRWLTPEEESKQHKTTTVVTDPKRARVTLLSEGEKTVSFFSDTCRKRFAFLKSMLAHSLLFLFVRPEEARKLMTEKDASKRSGSCVAMVVERLRQEGHSLGSGFGMLLLDNCWPGYVRVVGWTQENKEVDERLDVTNLVNIHVDRDDAKQWTFNHNQVLYKTVLYANNLGVQLVSNICWRNTTQGYNQVKAAEELTRTMQAMPNAERPVNLNIYKDVKFLYEQSRSAALLAYMSSQSDSMRKTISDAHLRYHFGPGYNQVRNMGQRGEVDPYTAFNARVEPVHAMWNWQRDIPSVRNTEAGGADWDPSSLPEYTKEGPADAAFRATATHKDIYTEKLCDELLQHTDVEVNNDEAWKALFEESGYSKCEVQGVIRLNNLCVNPFALCIYSKHSGADDLEAPGARKTKVYRIFGDLWFLQPLLIAVTKRSGWGYALKRFVTVQTWYRDDRQRAYLQDALYLEGWSSFVGGVRQ